MRAAADDHESAAQRKAGLGETDKLIRLPRLHDAPFVRWVEVHRRELDFPLEHDSKVIPRPRYRQMGADHDYRPSFGLPGYPCR